MLWAKTRPHIVVGLKQGHRAVKRQHCAAHIRIKKSALPHLQINHSACNLILNALYANAFLSTKIHLLIDKIDIAGTCHVSSQRGNTRRGKQLNLEKGKGRLANVQ